MKKWSLLIGGIVEVSGAIILYFNPELVFSPDIGAFILYRLYAVAILVIGIISLLTVKHYREDDMTRHLYMSIMFMHAAITLMTYTADNSVLMHPLQASMTHGILFIMFVVGYLTDIKKVDQ